MLSMLYLIYIIYIYMKYIYISMWKERIVDKDKMSKRRKSKLVFCLFGPLISWCFNGLNEKKICLELTTWLTYIYIYIYTTKKSKFFLM